MPTKVDNTFKTAKLLELYDSLKSQDKDVEILFDSVIYSTNKFTYDIKVDNYGWYKVKTVDGFATVFSIKDVMSVISTSSTPVIKRATFFESTEKQAFMPPTEKRPVGRPPKVIDLNEPPKEKRPVGRPPKIKTDISELMDLVNKTKNIPASVKNVGRMIKGYPFFDYFMECVSV